MNRSWGAIFDWDGVIVDSSPHHRISWERIAAEDGLPLPDGFFARSFGMKNERIIPEILGWAQTMESVRALAERKERIYRDVVREEGITSLPGVTRWLDQLQAASIPCAIGSSTCRANIDCVIDVIGLRAYFSTIVSGDDAQQGKPDPAIFQRAAAQLGLPPSQVVVFEDAHVGIEAAHAGGMRVVAVPTTHAAEELQAADRVVERLDTLSVSELGAWFG